MRTLAVLNQKGGVGKTTLATNLAAAAHLDGMRTLIIDMDTQSSSAEWYAARADSSRLTGLVVVKMDCRLTVQKFRELSGGFDFIVLDGPPRTGDVTTSAAVAADLVLMPVEPGPFDLWASHKTLASLNQADEIRAQLDRGALRRLFVANHADSRSSLAGETMEALADHGEVYGQAVYQRVVYKRAAAEGESVLTHGDQGAARDILALYRAVRERLQ